MKRDAIRTSIRYYLYEDTADLFSDDRINQAITDTLRELPRKNIYLEQLHTAARVVDQIDYTLPAGTLEVEKVEINLGTSTKPDWDEVKGWDLYGDALYLRSRPSDTYTMRVHIRKKFTDLTDDITDTDVPDEKLELIYAGSAYRCYKMLMGYFVDAKNWDSIAKPDGVSMNQVMNWLRMAREDYKELIQTFKTYPRPREINLVD